MHILGLSFISQLCMYIVQHPYYEKLPPFVMEYYWQVSKKMCLSVAVHRTVNIRLLSLPIYDFSKVLVVWLWMIYFDFNLPFKKNLLPIIFQLRGAQEIWLHVSITIEYNYCTSAHGLAIKSAKYWFKCLTLMGRPINCGSVPWLLLII